MVATKRITIEDLAALPPEFDRYELIEGELVEVSPASGDHGEVGSELHGRLWAYLHGRIVGRLFILDPGFVIARNPDTLLAPDIAFVSAERLAPGQRFPQYVGFAPDLAIEVVSPSNSRRELQRKVRLYLAAGTRLIWLVRPAQRTVTVIGRDQPERVLTENDTLDGGAVLPGFTLPLRELFGAVKPD
jgi:Uma2 family endonuclease